MEKTVVIYKSKYGTTEQYARWIAEELGCPLASIDDVKKRDLEKYDTVIFGGGVQAGGIRELEKFLKWIKSDLKILDMYANGRISREDVEKSGVKEKKILIFAVGINIDNEAAREQLMEINFPKKYMKTLPCFYLPGAYDPAKLAGADKTIMKMAMKMLQGKREIDVTEDDRILLSKMENGCDLVDRSRIQPIIEAVGSGLCSDRMM